MSIERKGGEPVFEKISQIAQEVALAHGAHVPTLIVLGERGSTAVQVSAQTDTHQARAALMKVIGYKLADVGNIGPLKQVCLVNEGWVSMASEEAAPDMVASKDLQRKEALIVAMIDLQANQTRMRLFEMVRDAEGKLIDLPPLDLGPPDSEVKAFLLEKFVDGYQKLSARRKAMPTQNGGQMSR